MGQALATIDCVAKIYGSKHRAYIHHMWRFTMLWAILEEFVARCWKHYSVIQRDWNSLTCKFRSLIRVTVRALNLIGRCRNLDYVFSR